MKQSETLLCRPYRDFKGYDVSPGALFGEGGLTRKVERVDPFTMLVYYSTVGRPNDGCQHTQRVETGFGTSYCKHCPVKFKFVNFQWVQC